MYEPFKLSRKQAMPILRKTFPNYAGRKITVEFTESVTFYDTNWGGGTKNTYRFIRSDGKTAAFDAPAPSSNPVEGKTIALPPDILVVCHVIFCGKECGIRIYSHPSNAPKLLEAA